MCEHHLIRATLIPEIIRMISDHSGVSEDEALDRFYRSATAANLADEENGLYGQSALFIFGMYLEENRIRGALRAGDESRDARGDECASRR